MSFTSKVVPLKAALDQRSDDEAGDAALLDRGGNLHDAAYQEIREALMDGRFMPGQTFTIRALAEVFGTSPMPVRDALKRLVAERALELRPNRSVVLPHMSRGRFQEILQIRLALEPLLANRASSRISAPEVAGMLADHQAMCHAVEQRDVVACLASNRRFHFRLYRAAQAVVTLPVVESMWMQVGPHLHQIFRSKKQAIATVDHHHNDILRALRRQDGAAAAKALWNDLSDAADEILATHDFQEEKL